MPIDTRFRPGALAISRVAGARRFLHLKAAPILQEHAAVQQRNHLAGTG